MLDAAIAYVEWERTVANGESQLPAATASGVAEAGVGV